MQRTNKIECGIKKGTEWPSINFCPVKIAIPARNAEASLYFPPEKF